MTAHPSHPVDDPQPVPPSVQSPESAAPHPAATPHDRGPARTGDRPPGRHRGRHRAHRRTARGNARRAAALLTVAVVIVATPHVAYAADPQVILAADSIEDVVNNLRVWLIGILALVATLFLTIGGLRYVAAGGDPGEVERAKSAFKSAAIGYGLALLAPLFVTLVAQLVA